jgi:predicted O-linked N-acetylglucosamine transferase (SPINDLY family)
MRAKNINDEFFTNPDAESLVSIKRCNVREEVTALNLVNFQLAELLQIKQQLEASIIKQLDHDIEGSKTYDVDRYKVTIKTDFIYALDKAEYEIYKHHIPVEFNPVKESIAYTVDKRVVNKAETYASSKELLLLSKIIHKKPAKPNIKVTANV